MNKDQNSWNYLPLMWLVSMFWSQMIWVIDTSVMQSQIIFMTGQSRDWWMPGMTKCWTLYVPVSQMPGLNRGDSVHRGVWTLSLPGSKGKGRELWPSSETTANKGSTRERLTEAVVLNLGFGTPKGGRRSFLGVGVGCNVSPLMIWN